MVGGTGSSGDPRITRNYWHTISNGENGWATPDPVNPDVVWTTGSGAGSVGGMVQRYVESRRQWRTVEVWPDHVAGPPAGKLAWLQQQKAAGKLDGDDADEVAEAESLLAMLIRLDGSKGSKQKRHLDELLDEGLQDMFPASDPVAVGHFTANEPPSRPIDSGMIEKSTSGKPRRRRRAAA